MSNQDQSIHFVSTHEQARALALRHNRFWVSNCGCREERGHCARSRIDICLIFRNDIGTSGTGLKEISLPEMLAIFEEAADKRLVTRPFRNDADRSVTDGICFCCDDCCGYFLNPVENRCDKGQMIESTDMVDCDFCGDCVATCYFGARKMEADELVVDRDNCHGCGLCEEVCPEGCIKMVSWTNQ
jgi:ferredoxin